MLPSRALLHLLLATLAAACAGARPSSPVAEASPFRLDAAELAPHAEAWERILAAEDARARTPAQLAVLTDATRSDAPALRLMAVRALGRVERSDLAPHIDALLRDPHAGVRAHAANALAQAARGGAVDRTPLEDALQGEMDPATAGVMAESLGRIRHADAAAGAHTATLLGARLTAARTDEERLGIVRGLYFLARQQGMREALGPALREALRGIASGEARAAGTGDVGATAVRLGALALATLTAAGAADAALAAAVQRHPAWTVRREGVLAAASLPDTAALGGVLASALTDGAAQVRYEALRAYGRRLAASHGCGPVRVAARDSDTHVRLLALELLASCPDAGAADVALLDSVAAAAWSAEWHAGARALVSLATLAPDRARLRLGSGNATGVPGPMPPSDPFARTWAARAFGVLGDTAALRVLAGDRDVNVRTTAIQALAPLAGRAGDAVYLAQLDSEDSQLLQAAAAALEGSTTPGAAVALLDALDRMTARRSETSRDARRALLRRAAELGSSALANRIEPYVRDFDPVIAALAADVLGAWTGTRPTPAPVAPPALPLPAFAEAAALAAGMVEIEMADGGRVLLRLLPFEAPTNAARFARLAERGFYDGLTLHRVVPNFVVQGGSPHANEYTGDGPFSRDELGLAGNWRGAVGLSTRGRDTGDAQLFINLIDNVRLDHDYTVFAVVVDGIDVVDALQEGARMRAVRVRR